MLKNHVTITVTSFCSWEINIYIRPGAIFFELFFFDGLLFYPTWLATAATKPLPGTDGQDICFFKYSIFPQPPTRQKLDYQCLCKLSKLWHNKIPGNVHAQLKAALYIMHCNSNRQVAIFDRYTHFPCQTHERQYIFLKLKWKPFNRYNGHNEFHFALLMHQRRSEALARTVMRPRETGNHSEALTVVQAATLKPGYGTQGPLRFIFSTT